MFTTKKRNLLDRQNGYIEYIAQFTTTNKIIHISGLLNVVADALHRHNAMRRRCHTSKTEQHQNWRVQDLYNIRKVNQNYVVKCVRRKFLCFIYEL